MSKFKVGDKVRCIKHSGLINVGDIRTVKIYAGGNNKLKGRLFVGNASDKHTEGWYFPDYEDSFELVVPKTVKIEGWGF